MDVNLVDADGSLVPIQRLMLHHIVFANLNRPDGTCDRFTLWDSTTQTPFVPERFYASGEERAVFALPPGYGYRLDTGDQWIIAWMLPAMRSPARRPLPAPLGPTRPHVAPRFTMPLTGLDGAGNAVRIQRPPGAMKVVNGSARVRVGDFSFSQPNLSVPRGSTVSWRFRDPELHSVTLASGPRGFSSPNLNGGRSFKAKLTVPGRYRLFCALHPVAMTEVVDVH
jgi:plastocyanin